MILRVNREDRKPTLHIFTCAGLAADPDRESFGFWDEFVSVSFFFLESGQI